MPKLPVCSGAEVVYVLISLGFEQRRQRGSHVVLRKENIVCVVPLHNELKIGTLRNVLKQSEVSVAEFLSAYKKH
ncbi:MAG: type II toxin-antitoxin system HicA family toxin [Actinomycetota bacterium]